MRLIQLAYGYSMTTASVHRPALSAGRATALNAERDMKSGDIKLILLHCPADLIDEVDELCELNFVNRTEFILFAIDSMTDFYERRSQRANRDLLNDEDAYCPIPGDGVTSLSSGNGEEAEDDELLLTAAEDEDEDNYSVFFPDEPGDGDPEDKRPE